MTWEPPGPRGTAGHMHVRAAIRLSSQQEAKGMFKRLKAVPLKSLRPHFYSPLETLRELAVYPVDITLMSMPSLAQLLWRSGLLVSPRNYLHGEEHKRGKYTYRRTGGKTFVEIKSTSGNDVRPLVPLPLRWPVPTLMKSSMANGCLCSQTCLPEILRQALWGVGVLPPLSVADDQVDWSNRSWG